MKIKIQPGTFFLKVLVLAAVCCGANFFSAGGALFAQTARRGLTNRDLDSVRVAKETPSGAASENSQTPVAQESLSPEQEPSSPHTGACVFKGAVDPAYVQTAEESGGQVLMLDASETEHIAELGNLRLRGLSETIFRAGGALDGEAREFIVPLDAGVERVAFVVFVECKDAIKIISPSGRDAAEEAYLAHQNLRAGRFLIVNAPLTGVWRVRVRGRGKFSIVALAKSALALQSLKFVESPGEAAQTVRVRLSGHAAAASQLKVVAADGRTIQTIALEKVSAGEDDGEPEFVGTVRLPAHGFRLAIEGFDERGLNFQRMHPPLLRGR